MKFMHISLLVVFSVFMSMSVAQGQGDLSVSGTTTTNALILSGLDCTANANGGALTADGSGVVSCSDDDDTGGDITGVTAGTGLIGGGHFWGRHLKC